jgi:uncharacterized protein (DUF4415 family)
MSAKTTGKTVRFTYDPKNPPRFTKKERERLLAMTDDQIDLSDIPDMGGTAWTRPGALVPTENKKQVSLRIDADVLSFYKSTGRRYQTRINEVLRRYMEAQTKTGQREMSRRKKSA